jgi:hypothetical protein
MALALVKKGLLKENVRKDTGALYLADIGIPCELYEEPGIDAGNIFTDKI